MAKKPVLLCIMDGFGWVPEETFGKSSKCIACGACVAGCPSGALSIVDWDAVTSAAQAAYMDL